ncbi:peroxisomal assembly protein [Recurvomyces mirabilis]|nr:peroxisomal assembly protein [Recurvomyces mirabilis]
MAYENPTVGSLKRKRRRREDKPPISARIFLDGSLKGDVGVLSEDLLLDLFPGHGPHDSGTLYTALTPWTPNTTITESNWTILPLRTQLKDEKALPASTLRFPAAASSMQSFANLIQASSPNRVVRLNTAVEVKISDVVPLALETVIVTVDAEAIAKLEEAQKRCGKGFAGANGYAAKRGGKHGAVENGNEVGEKDDETRQKQLVREALQKTAIVHVGDLLNLGLTHPVTHARAPPARVLACEPVSQGLLSSSTRIVITAASDTRQHDPRGHALMSPRLDEETDEDTSNEAFFSATEENSPMKPIVTSKSTTDLSNTDDLFDSSTEDSNLSDDSDDMISLAKPGITDGPSGISSAMSSSTQRPFGGRGTGVSTPGSVFSNVTASTIRGGQATKTKVFRAQGLMERISNELLHPKPASTEDEEARVYVDSTALARLGCFSGDWVQIESVESHGLPQLSAFGGFDAASTQFWRPVKVYGLPEHMSRKPARYPMASKHGRRDSISSIATTAGTPATLYASPILLANLDNPESVSLSPLSFGRRQAAKRGMTQRPPSSASRQPPIASEVTLRKVVTPLSSERALSHILFANLKEYFESRQRIVNAGDLIAIPIDGSLGRSLYEGEAEQEGTGTGPLLSQWHQDGSKSDPATSEVAWFSIESVNVASEDEEATDITDLWAGAASIDPSRMTMRQSGDEKRKLPSATSNVWPYYMGVHKAAKKAAQTGQQFLPEPVQTSVTTLQRRLRELISVSSSPRAVHLGMPPLALLLTSTQRSIGKSHMVQQVCADLGLHYFAINGFDIASEGSGNVDTQTQGLLEARCERALDCGPEYTALCIKHIETLSSDRVAAPLKTVLESARVLVATTTDVDKIPDGVRGLFTHELEMTAPDEGEREGILKSIVAGSGVPLAPEVDLAAIAVKTAALVAGDLVDVVDRALVARTDRLTSLAKGATDQYISSVTLKDIQLSGGTAATSLTPADFEAAVDLARKNFADSIGAPKIPNVQWSDVGGLTHVKDAVVETIQLPLSRPELFAKGLKKRSGILFYGPPGTGKTLLAKAIATEFSLNFFSVKGPELLNMYIGESEANVRRVFQRARDARPCVVFFDELDSVAPKRGNQGDSGGVMDRIVSQLLAELDGMSDGEDSGGGVFVIGATNRPDLLDQALLRPGRFDKMLYLGISDTHDKQATILQALTRKFRLDPALSLPKVSESLPFTFTGADLYALCSDAMLKAVTRSAKLVDQKLAVINDQRVTRGQSKASVAYFFDHHATEDDLEVLVTDVDFTNARRELVPSVSLDELQHYERVRDTFEGTTKKPVPKANADVARPLNARSQSSQRDIAQSRAQLAALMKRAQAEKDRGMAMNGHAGNGHQAGPGADDESDDDYVVRTDRLAINGGKKGKGKGKSAGMASDEHDEVGEDLYD